MELKDFNTLADAKAYAPTVYNKLSTAFIWQTLIIYGDVSKINNLKNSTAVVSIDTGVNTTLGDVATGFMESLTSTDSLNVDPTTDEGTLNRTILQRIRQNGGLSTGAVQKLVAKSQSQRTPFLNATLYQFEHAKGIAPKVQKPVVDGWVSIETNAEATDLHSPRVYTLVNGVYEEIGGFSAVKEAGKYNAKVGAGFTTAFVDNTYNVII